MTGQVVKAVGTALALQEEKRRAEMLAELDRSKTIFFSNVSHEFRYSTSIYHLTSSYTKLDAYILIYSPSPSFSFNSGPHWHSSWDPWKTHSQTHCLPFLLCIASVWPSCSAMPCDYCVLSTQFLTSLALRLEGCRWALLVNPIPYVISPPFIFFSSSSTP